MKLLNVFIESILPKLFHKIDATATKILSKEIKIAKMIFKKELSLCE